jgi:hypothetical protein
MAKFPQTIIVKQSDSGNGDQLLEVGFLKRQLGSDLMSSIDSRFGTKSFRLTAGALRVLQDANERINNALERLRAVAGSKREANEKASPMGAHMAVFMYTRKIEPRFLPESEIILDEEMVRGLLKRHFKGYF